MKNSSYVCCLILASLCLFGCGERRAKTGSPSSYSKAGISFNYPGNWKVKEDVIQEGLRYLFVESPGDALVIIQIYSEDDALKVDEFAKLFAQSAKENTPIGNVSESTFSSVTISDGYEVLTEQFSITVLGEKVPHTRNYRRKAVADQVCLIIDQISDEDSSKVAKGFELISSSFEYKVP